MRFLSDHIRRIKNDPTARWVYMGDGGECVTKLSKGDLYGQLLSPQGQMECLVKLLEPIQDKGLLAIRGNHGGRIYRESGLSFDQNLAARLGLPYLGVAAMATLQINRSAYDLFFHHGIDSGVALRAKVSRAEEFGKFIVADALFTAHSHVAMNLQPSAVFTVNRATRKVETTMRQQYICGSSYDSRTGYAEEKGYTPLLPSYLAVTFDGRIIEGIAQQTQEHRVWRSDGQHELTHEYIMPFLREGEGG